MPKSLAGTGDQATDARFVPARSNLSRDGHDSSANGIRNSRIRTCPDLRRARRCLEARPPGCQRPNRRQSARERCCRRHRQGSAPARRACERSPDPAWLFSRSGVERCRRRWASRPRPALQQNRRDSGNSRPRRSRASMPWRCSAIFSTAATPGGGNAVGAPATRGCPLQPGRARECPGARWRTG